MEKLKKSFFWQNSKAQILTKLKNSNCDKTQKNLIVTKHKKATILKPQIATKLENSNCDKTKKTQIVTAQELRMWQNFKT